MLAIGNQTSFATRDPAEPFDFAAANGFGAFEWFPDRHGDAGWDEASLDAAQREDLRARAEAQGIRLSVHSRLQADVFAPDAETLFRRDIELARDLGAELLNLHLNHERGMSAFVAALAPLLRWTNEAGLALSIENTPHHSPEDFNALFAGLRRLTETPVGHVGMCFDLGHANLSPATRNDYLRFLDLLDQRVPISHVHLHENWGDADTHLTLFTGPSARNDAGVRGVLRRLRARGFSGLAILEQWPSPPELLTAARDRLMALWTGLDQGSGAAGSSDASIRPGRPLAPRPPLGEAVGAPRPLGSAPAPGAVAPSTETDLIAELVEANQRCRSWREKLEAVRCLIAREAPPLASPQLVDVAIYLRFLGTGEIPCAEDGRHFRPVHHARIGRQIRERLARLTTPETGGIVRRIWPWLPSSAPAFQRAEPLTRIRDLAHRNDIPAGLKREIKESLQNKLHRCAGPEDLVVSGALLARITAPGAGYAADFVEQFRIFHRELQEFFNARSLDDQLTALIEKTPGEAELIRSFLAQKTAAIPADVPALFAKLTAIRRGLQARLREGEGAVGRGQDARATLKEDGQDDRATWEEWMLADIALEDYAFVLLSEQINTFEGTRPEVAWPALIGVLSLAVENAALSGIEPEEGEAIEHELSAWSAAELLSREARLRLKATVERAQRLAETHSERLIARFAARAERLGRALAVAEHAMRVFGEAEVRAHLVFQISRLCAYAARRLRADLGQRGWDVVVTGTAAGRLRVVEGLDEPRAMGAERAVLLVRQAAGDEEIPEGVAGVVLAHELPHLSHLAVRARQAGVVLVAGEEPRLLADLERAAGQWVLLTATADGASWNVGTALRAAGVTTPRPSIRLPQARMTSRSGTIPLAEARIENAGGKADGLRRLAELSAEPNALFRTAAAIVVPFGVMETALASVPEAGAEYRRLVQALAASPENVDNLWGRLHGLVAQLPVPDAITAAASRRFGPQARLMVRSSANCEDRETMAGAGLYDSVANVPVAGVAQAVATVWASLWTRRAVVSRTQSGVPHSEAHVAVVIQQMITPEFSFVLHTVNPLDGNRAEVYAEAAVGLGETLVGGAARGSPYRLVCPKNGGPIRMLAFANFSRALEPGVEGSSARTLDYSRSGLSTDGGLREALGKRLGAIGAAVEEACGRPQDIEGLVAGPDIFLVQARAQQGLC